MGLSMPHLFFLMCTLSYQASKNINGQEEKRTEGLVFAELPMRLTARSPLWSLSFILYGKHFFQ